MKKDEKYRITWEKQQQDGTWEKHDPIETQSFALLTDKGGGIGVNAIFMNISNKDLALMFVHVPPLRETVAEFLPPILLANKLLGKQQKGEEADGDPGEEIDVEKLLTCVEKTADGKNADTAVMDEDLAPARKKGWLRRLFKK